MRKFKTCPARALVARLQGKKLRPGRPSKVRSRTAAEPAPVGPIHAEERLLCNKILYANEMKANDAAKHHKQRAYRCLPCGGWHLTSRKKN